MKKCACQKCSALLQQNLLKQASMEKNLKFGKCNGFPASFYELVQQLGRVDRNGMAEPGSNTYEIHVDLYSYVCFSFHSNTEIRQSRRKEGAIETTARGDAVFSCADGLLSQGD